VHTFTGNAIDTALVGIKHVFIEKGSPEWKDFPPSRRALFTRISKIPSFWTSILHSETIDLTRFRLPSKITSLTFQFINPVWAWIQAAEKQPAIDMHWKPAAQHRDNPVYGGGIQYGQCFLQASKSCPQGTYPMLMNLHWDGTHGHGLECTPISIGVANTNSLASDTQYCIGYMPHVPDETTPEFSSSQRGNRRVCGIIVHSCYIVRCFLLRRGIYTVTEFKWMIAFLLHCSVFPVTSWHLHCYRVQDGLLYLLRCFTVFATLHFCYRYTVIYYVRNQEQR